MQRRIALKNLATLVGGVISLPAWASSWNPSSLPASPALLTADQTALLAEVVETIIPATDTPGAKELGIHAFVEKMVADCYEPVAAQNLTKGLEAVEAAAQKSFGKSFAGCDTGQRVELLKGFEKADEAEKKGFYSLVKGLTIRGYMNSEYVMTNLTHYELVPGRYHGCVPVPAK